MTFLRRERAAAAIAAILVAACSSTPVPSDPNDGVAPLPLPSAPDPSPAPAPPTPAPDTDDLPPIAGFNPDLGWPWTDDLERMASFTELVDAAFDAGAEAGLRFLAERAWPDGYTADAMLACRTSEPTPTYAELDALDSIIMPPDVEFSDVSIPRSVMDRTVGELCRSRLR